MAAGDAVPARDDLALARVALAQGRLVDAEALLVPLAAPSAAPGLRAPAELLLGNVRFERGDFAAAAALYDDAARGYALDADPARAEAGAVVARDNLELARSALARRDLRRGQADRLESVTAGVVLAALVLIAALARRARRSAGGPGHPTQRMSSSSSIAGTRAR